MAVFGKVPQDPLELLHMAARYLRPYYCPSFFERMRAEAAHENAQRH
jgi:hypothetical protein